MIAEIERRDGRTCFMNDADAFVTENASRLTTRHIALQDVQIGAANRCARDAHDRVGRIDDGRHRTFVERSFSRAVIYECFHSRDTSMAKLKVPPASPRN